MTHSSSPPALPSSRSFGVVFAVFFFIVAVFPLFHGNAFRWWAIGLSCSFLAVAYICPHVLTPLNKVWMKFGELLHHIISPVAMGIVFFVVILPTGLIMRTLGKDLLRQKLDPNANSYWIERNPPGPAPDTLKLPF